MKKSEFKHLRNIKESFGLDPESANEEVMDFIKSQKGYKLLKKECNKKETKIKSLEKKIEILTTKLRDEKNKSIKNQPILKKEGTLGKKVFKKDISKLEMIKIRRFITRIKDNIEPSMQYTKSDFLRNLLIPKRYFEICISTLLKEDFLVEGYINYAMRYWKK